MSYRTCFRDSVLVQTVQPLWIAFGSVDLVLLTPTLRTVYSSLFGRPGPSVLGVYGDLLKFEDRWSTFWSLVNELESLGIERIGFCTLPL